MQTLNRRLMATLLAPIFLGACQTMQHDIDHQSEAAAAQISAYSKQQLTQNVTSNARVVQRVSGSWLGGHAIPMQADATLPEIFRRDGWKFQYPDKGNIMTVAERLTKNTGMPVRVQPDVLMPISAFMTANGTSSNQTTADASPVGSAVAAAQRSSLPPLPSPAAGGALAAGSSSILSANDNQLFDMNYVGTLQGYLELLCARAGISWDYYDGVITLRRMVTKTFTVKAIPGSSGFDAALGRDGQTQTGAQGGTQGTSAQSGGYASTAKVKMDSSFSVWKSIEASIQAVKTPVGRYSISEATGSVTVTDTRSAVEEISRIINHENSTLTRQVAMRVEVLSVKITGGQDYGIDWTAVFNKVTNMVPWALTYSSPASLVDPTLAGGLGINVLTRTDGGGSTWSGSQALFNALAQYGRVKIVTTANALTVNRQPVPVAITQQTGYLAEITPAPAGASGSAGGTPGLTPGTVTTGFMLNLLPTVLDSNSILLQFSVGISSLDALVKQSSGSGSTLQSIQTPTISSTDFLQKVAMRPGETLILSGYERSSGQYDKRTLTEGAPIGLGGSFSGNDDREAVVILVTPVVTEGAI